MFKRCSLWNARVLYHLKINERRKINLVRSSSSLNICRKYRCICDYINFCIKHLAVQDDKVFRSNWQSFARYLSRICSKLHLNYLSLFMLMESEIAKKKKRLFFATISSIVCFLGGTKILKVISLMGDAYDIAFKACSWPYSHIRMHL